MAVEYEGLMFERLGHASVRIETPDESIVYIDPWSEMIDDDPGDADVVFVTHDDFDHYDPDGIDAVASADTKVVIYEAVDTSDLDYPVIDLAYDGEQSVAGVTARAVPAHNQPDGEHVDDEGEPFHQEGEVIGLVLTIAGTTIYFASDTDFLDEHADITADVFLPPIGGHYTMGRREAAEFARSVDPDLVLPVHYDTFDAIQTDASAFTEELEEDGIAVKLF